LYIFLKNLTTELHGVDTELHFLFLQMTYSVKDSVPPCATPWLIVI